MNTPRALLMTATPHRGKEWLFRALLHLVDPEVFPTRSTRTRNLSRSFKPGPRPLPPPDEGGPRRLRRRDAAVQGPTRRRTSASPLNADRGRRSTARRWSWSTSSSRRPPAARPHGLRQARGVQPVRARGDPQAPPRRHGQRRCRAAAALEADPDGDDAAEGRRGQGHPSSRRTAARPKRKAIKELLAPARAARRRPGLPVVEVGAAGRLTCLGAQRDPARERRAGGRVHRVRRHRRLARRAAHGRRVTPPALLRPRHRTRRATTSAHALRARATSRSSSHRRRQRRHRPADRARPGQLRHPVVARPARTADGPDPPGRPDPRRRALQPRSPPTPAKGEILEVLLDNFVTAANELDGQMFDSLSLVGGARRPRLTTDSPTSWPTLRRRRARARRSPPSRAVTAARLADAAQHAAAQEARSPIQRRRRAGRRRAAGRAARPDQPARSSRRSSTALADGGCRHVSPHAAGRGIFTLALQTAHAAQASSRRPASAARTSSSRRHQREALAQRTGERRGRRRRRQPRPERPAVHRLWSRCARHDFAPAMFRGGALVDQTSSTDYDLFAYEADLTEAGGKRKGTWSCLVRVDDSGCAHRCGGRCSRTSTERPPAGRAAPRHGVTTPAAARQHGGSRGADRARTRPRRTGSRSRGRELERLPIDAHRRHRGPATPASANARRLEGDDSTPARRPAPDEPGRRSANRASSPGHASRRPRRARRADRERQRAHRDDARRDSSCASRASPSPTSTPRAAATTCTPAAAASSAASRSRASGDARAATAFSMTGNEVLIATPARQRLLALRRRPVPRRHRPPLRRLPGPRPDLRRTCQPSTVIVHVPGSALKARARTRSPLTCA